MIYAHLAAAAAAAERAPPGPPGRGGRRRRPGRREGPRPAVPDLLGVRRRAVGRPDGPPDRPRGPPQAAHRPAPVLPATLPLPEPGSGGADRLAELPEPLHRPTATPTPAPAARGGPSSPPTPGSSSAPETGPAHAARSRPAPTPTPAAEPEPAPAPGPSRHPGAGRALRPSRRVDARAPIPTRGSSPARSRPPSPSRWPARSRQPGPPRPVGPRADRRARGARRRRPVDLHHLDRGRPQDVEYKVTRLTPDGRWQVVGRTRSTSIVDGAVTPDAEIPVYEVVARPGRRRRPAPARPRPPIRTGRYPPPCSTSPLPPRARSCSPGRRGSPRRWWWSAPTGRRRRPTDPAATAWKITNMRYQLDGGLMLPASVARPCHVAVASCRREGGAWSSPPASTRPRAPPSAPEGSAPAPP